MGAVDNCRLHRARDPGGDLGELLGAGPGVVLTSNGEHWAGDFAKLVGEVPAGEGVAVLGVAFGVDTQDHLAHLVDLFRMAGAEASGEPCLNECVGESAHAFSTRPE